MCQIDNLKRSEALLKQIVYNQFYNCGANGDIFLMAALTRFVCFCLQFDKASYQHLKAIELQNKAKHNNVNFTEGDKHLLLFNIQDAIQEYNACYDTLLQAIKFAFRLVESIGTKDDLLHVFENNKWLSYCRITGIKDLLIEQYDAKDDDFKSFLDVSSNFFETKRGKNAKYANSIKHNGGIILPSLKTFIPNVSKAIGNVSFIKHHDGKYKFNVPNDANLFKLEWLYPLEVKPIDILQRLSDQNKWIYEYVNYLFRVLQYDKLKELPALSGNYVFPFEHLKR